ncbi:hypothetical protein R1sor_003289 [Riccia sorocarpa]|uniref:C2H2-type domain-containing protein n=1 Tax=Riccia sorocarpa TaxID=122646 RepID=A0ABD3H467_9MARC
MDEEAVSRRTRGKLKRPGNLDEGDEGRQGSLGHDLDQENDEDYRGSLDQDEEDEDSEGSLSTEESDEDSPPSPGVEGSRKKKQKEKKYTCQECDYAASKPALLIQHLRSHSDQKPFSCPVDGCLCKYKRQDHLLRHMRKHEGTRFRCSVPGCDQSFSIKSNLERHLKRHQDDPSFPRPKYSGEKNHKCSHPGCDKAFRFKSQLQTHEDTVHGVLNTEFICVYPGCGDKFTSDAELVKHAVEAHPYLLCEVCGETIARRNFSRHIRNHGAPKPVKVTCPYEGCTHEYNRETNLRIHIEAVHLKRKPFVCSYEGCGKRFSYKCVLERHELSAVHVHTGIDFEEELMRQRTGGRKKVRLEKIEDLYIRKKRPNNKGKGRKKRNQQEGKRFEEVEEPVDEMAKGGKGTDDFAGGENGDTEFTRAEDIDVLFGDEVIEDVYTYTELEEMDTFSGGDKVDHQEFSFTGVEAWMKT